MSRRDTGARFRLEDRTGEALRAIENALNRGLNRVAIHWHGEARQASPWDTGRLRASIAFATPTSQPSVTYTDEGGITVTYQGAPPPELTAEVGTNVQYAAAVHEGLSAREVKVRAHTRRITKAWGRPISPRAVSVAPFTRRQAARSPTKFIEGPGRANQDRYRAMIDEELRSVQT